MLLRFHFELLGELDAFDLGHTFDPKTFGIWMHGNEEFSLVKIRMAKKWPSFCWIQKELVRKYF